MAEELRYDGKVAIVTGAGAGLGRAYALLLASRGAKVVVNDLGGNVHGGADGNNRPADLVVKEIQAKGGVAVADYNNVVDGAKVVQTALDAFGRVDILINNAGVLRDVTFHKMKEKDWQTVLTVHLQGSYAVTKAAWPVMRSQKYGRVVFITSVNGLYGQFGQTNYSAAKSGILGLMKSLSKEGKKYNIKVNAVAPGAGSRMTATVMPEELVKKWKPEYVAPTVTYLCHESIEDTGKIFESGGGWTAQVKYARSPGHFFDIKNGFTIEDVRNNWNKIKDFENETYPDEDEGISPQMKQIINSKL